jgi:hypothetical protein
MLWLAAHAFIASMWALIYWGTIKVLDRYNVKNTFGVALCMGALYAFSFSFPLPGLVMVAAWLLLLMRITMWHYDISLFGAAIATASTVLVPYFVVPYLLRFIGDSEVRGYGMLYGVPAVTLGVYVASRLRANDAGDKPKWGPREPELAEARVVEIAKPVAPVAVAPPKYTPAPVGDKPSLLS